MMKTIKRIGGLVAVFLFTIYNTCFADVVMPGGTSHPSPLREVGDDVPAIYVLIGYVLIGILVLVVIICTVIIIRRIIKNKKDKENDNNK